MIAGAGVVPDSRFLTRRRSYADVFEPGDRTATHVAGGNIPARFTPIFQVTEWELA